MVPQELHPQAMTLLREHAEVVVPVRVDALTLVKEGAKAEGLIVRLIQVGKDLMTGMPRLKVIGRHGVGVDNIDMKAATERGIAVVNTPGTNTVTVAEYTIGAILMLAKQFAALNREVRKGHFSMRDKIMGSELHGKKLGIVGYGAIGRLVGRYACTLGMLVCYYDPLVGQEEGACKMENLAELLGQSDFVTVHVPFTPETANLLGEQELRLMPPGSYFINASRGGIVDENALYNVLASGHLGGAVIDVLREEPFPAAHPLYGLENVLITPHIAGLSRECVIRMGMTVVQDVLRALRGERPQHLVNPVVWPG